MNSQETLTKKPDYLIHLVKEHRKEPLNRVEDTTIVAMIVNKLTVLLLIAVLTLSGLTMVGSAFAQALSKPSVPEFTAKVVDDAIEVTIKNQPVPPYENGSYPGLYYMFRFKDHNERVGFWDYDPVYFVLPSTYGGYHEASDSDFTVVSLSLEGRNYFPSGQIDLQVIALFGTQYPTSLENGGVYGFDGVVGSWSDHQTFASEEEADVPEFPSWLILPLLITSSLLAIIFKKKAFHKICN